MRKRRLGACEMYLFCVQLVYKKCEVLTAFCEKQSRFRIAYVVYRMSDSVKQSQFAGQWPQIRHKTALLGVLCELCGQERVEKTKPLPCGQGKSGKAEGKNEKTKPIPRLRGKSQARNPKSQTAKFFSAFSAISAVNAV